MSALYDIGSLFRVTDTVTRGSFDSFVKPIIARLPGIQALEWIPQINDSIREEYEAHVQQEGFKHFTIRERVAGEMVTANRRSHYFPVHFVSPFDLNRNAFGYDLASNPS